MLLSAKKRVVATLPWTPQDASGGQPKWLLTETGINTSGSDITTWDNDVSADTLTPGTPKAQAVVVNGRTVAEFSIDDYYAGSDLFGGSAAELDIYKLIYRPATTGVHISMNGDSGSPRYIGFSPLSGGTVYWDVGGFVSPNRISKALSGTTWNTSEWGIVNLRNSVINNSQQIYVNAELESSDGTGHDIATTGGLRLGKVLGQQSGAHLALCVIFDYYLGSTDRQKMEGWMAHYISELGMLPGAHPYSSNPPVL